MCVGEGVNHVRPSVLLFSFFYYTIEKLNDYKFTQIPNHSIF
ncbi:hypothetical protein FEDK69T_06520 [Flavobacterium enshiense DK69]|nr:hypothetical protein FEDK69T_06520 [Flavobacterium enshiense DK69]